MSADTTALVAAAGIGSRLGLGPKAFLVLDGETLLQRVCATARAVAPAVRVAVPPGMQARCLMLMIQSFSRRCCPSLPDMACSSTTVRDMRCRTSSSASCFTLGLSRRGSSASFCRSSS